ncbi:unnamed protein product, partial [Mesorhabditis belari]|uniref:C2H2-type domain-containing protein n=1 Tax=Mesorhabditis belari TaxID=2138241 RepID=A0AAF3JAC8_9BILA
MVELRCELCKLSFADEYDIRLHEATIKHQMSNQTNVKCYNCNLCSYRCQTITDFSKHVQSVNHRLVLDACQKEKESQKKQKQWNQEQKNRQLEKTLQLAEQGSDRQPQPKIAKNPQPFSHFESPEKKPMQWKQPRLREYPFDNPEPTSPYGFYPPRPSQRQPPGGYPPAPFRYNNTGPTRPPNYHQPHQPGNYMPRNAFPDAFSVYNHYDSNMYTPRMINVDVPPPELVYQSLSSEVRKPIPLMQLPFEPSTSRQNDGYHWYSPYQTDQRKGGAAEKSFIADHGQILAPKEQIAKGTISKGTNDNDNEKTRMLGPRNEKLQPTCDTGNKKDDQMKIDETKRTFPKKSKRKEANNQNKNKATVKSRKDKKKFPQKPAPTSKVTKKLSVDPRVLNTKKLAKKRLMEACKQKSKEGRDLLGQNLISTPPLSTEDTPGTSTASNSGKISQRVLKKLWQKRAPGTIPPKMVLGDRVRALNMMGAKCTNSLNLRKQKEKERQEILSEQPKVVFDASTAKPYGSVAALSTLVQKGGPVTGVNLDWQAHQQPSTSSAQPLSKRPVAQNSPSPSVEETVPVKKSVVSNIVTSKVPAVRRPTDLSQNPPLAFASSNPSNIDRNALNNLQPSPGISDLLTTPVSEHESTVEQNELMSLVRKRHELKHRREGLALQLIDKGIHLEALRHQFEACHREVCELQVEGKKIDFAIALNEEKLKEVEKQGGTSSRSWMPGSST